jgi:hypothetical protein
VQSAAMSAGSRWWQRLRMAKVVEAAAVGGKCYFVVGIGSLVQSGDCSLATGSSFVAYLCCVFHATNVILHLLHVTNGTLHLPCATSATNVVRM